MLRAVQGQGQGQGLLVLRWCRLIMFRCPFQGCRPSVLLLMLTYVSCCCYAGAQINAKFIKHAAQLLPLGHSSCSSLLLLLLLARQKCWP